MGVAGGGGVEGCRGADFVLSLVVMEHAWEAGAGAEVEGMWHDGSTDDATGLVDAKKGQLEGRTRGVMMENARLLLEKTLRWEVALQHFCKSCVFEHGELHTEAYNDPEDKEEDEEFERSQASNTTTWSVKEENEEHIQNRNGTACYQR